MPALRALGLGKRYHLGLRHGGTLRDTVTSALHAARRRTAPPLEVWALREVDFEVERGEVVGVLGHNGAGKSTLLKLLSRITEPTTGSCETRGRVGSLLEVGTGFHPELTGRENIYLSGAVLGMRRAEIRSKFDRIVEFSGVEPFLDTPVKRYSSGMYVRLGFSVAVHLEPEILLVDEVLAVGDLSFQRKCLARMQELTRGGLTILLVSHNLAAIQTACSRALLFERGRLTLDGAPSLVVDRYRAAVAAGEVPALEAGTDGPVRIVAFELTGEDGRPTRCLRFGESPRFSITIEAREPVFSPMINFGLKRGDGVIVCNFNNWYDDFEIACLQGTCVLEGELPPLRLTPEFYEIHTHVWPWGGGHLEGEIGAMQPLAGRVFGDLRIEGPALNWHDGVFQLPARHWVFRRQGTVVERVAGDPAALGRAFRPASRRP